ncbi:MAG: DUF4249 domain-containing protein [Bacteroidota bacterium]
MKHIFYTILVLVIFITGCEKPFHPEIPSVPEKLVLYSQFSPDNEWSVYLTKSRSVLSNEPFSPLPNAEIQIFDEAALVSTLTFSQETGLYNSDEKPVAGMTYELVASVEGFADVKSTDEIPVSGVEIESFSFLDKSENGDDIFSLSFRDILPQDDYYHLVVILQKYEYTAVAGADTSFVLLDERPARFSIDEDTRPDNSPANIIPSITTQNFEGVLVEDSDFNNGQAEIFLQVWNEIENDMPDKIAYGYVVELRSVSEAYYLYQKTLTEQLGENATIGIHEVPRTFPIDIYNNIENGLGNFSGYSVVNSSLVWKQ